MKDQIHRQTLIALNAHGEKYPESVLCLWKITFASETHATQRLSTSDTLPSIYVKRRINVWVVHTHLYNCRYFGYEV